MPTKHEALWAAIGLFALAMLLFMVQIASCGWVFLLIAGGFGAIYITKAARDASLTAPAVTPVTSNSWEEQPTSRRDIPMTSPGSGRLYVPPPLDSAQ